MNKRLIFFLCAFCSVISWGQTWNLTTTMKATLDNNGSLTINATGISEAMPLFALWNPEGIYHGAAPPPWYSVRSNILSVIIESKVVTINRYAFQNCTNLSSVYIPNSITSMEDAFIGCIDLKDVTVEWASTLAIPSMPFENITTATLHVPTGTKVLYENANGWKDFGTIIDDAGTLNEAQTWYLSSTMTASLNKDGELTITTSLAEEAMPDYGFLVDYFNIYYWGANTVSKPYCPWWTTDIIHSVVIEEGVTSIGKHTFYSSKNITSVTITNSVTVIGDYSFNSCTGLQTVTIPNSVTSIGFNAFGTSGLTSITIPNSVTNLESFAFMCNSLADVKVERLIPLPLTKYNIDVFPLDKSTITLHVPLGTKGLYEVAEIWKDFGTIDDGTPATIPITGITLNQSSLAMQIAETYQLTETILPTNATNKNVSWSSSNATVATISSTGLVTAVAEGTTVISAATAGGGFIATCNVKVEKLTIPVTGITLNKTSLTMQIAATEQLTAAVSPATATNRTVNWSSSNASVATVSSTGLVTAISEGTAIIIVTTADGGFIATCNVKVEKLTIPVTGITLNQSSLAMQIAETAQLTATVSPATATNRTVNWSSSNASVATVSSTGLVTAVAEGTTVISAATAGGGFTATCNVTVRKQEIAVGDGDKNKIVLSLTIPANTPFSGTFQLVLPNGVQLDLDMTRLASDLATKMTLTVVQNADGSYSFTLAPFGLRSATEMVYSKIVEIAYKANATVSEGKYEAHIRNLSFEFSNGAHITEQEMPVSITVSSTTGIPELSTKIFAYINNNRLHIQSPVAESVQVYSMTGLLLHTFQKPEGNAVFRIHKKHGAVLIVTGSSGWVKKIVVD